jgi:arylmalonate decarboxylase
MRFPILGMILPPANRPVPPEAKAAYPEGIEFRAECLGLADMTPDGYEGVIDRIVPAARKLANEGANAIALMGTSLTFYKGAAFNQELVDSVAKVTGLPATSMSTAIVDGMRRFGAKRIAVATAYSAEVNRRMRGFLEESGFEVLAMEGLGFEKIGMAGGVPKDQLVDFAVGVHAAAPAAEALLVSCGGFRTLDAIEPLEARTGVPVVSSMPHAVWAGVRLLGVDGRAQGFGRLFAL